MTTAPDVSRELPVIRLWSPSLWWRYWVRFFASFVPPSPVKSRLYGMAGIAAAIAGVILA